MEKQRPADQNDIFDELYGADDSTWTKSIDIPKGNKIKVNISSGYGKAKGSGKAGGIVVAVLIVAILVGAGIFLLSRSCIFGHDWQEASCLYPKFCRSCGETEGVYLGHQPGEGSCTEPTCCLVCGMVLAEAQGHDWRLTYRDCEHCFARIPDECLISAGAAKLKLENETHYYKVFAISSNKWAGVHVNQNAELFSLTEKPTWEDVERISNDFGGRVAEITSAEIQEFVFTELIQDKFQDEIVYFALTDAETEDQWVWFSGEPLTYSNWHSGDPDGRTYENYAGFYGKYTDGTWADGNFKEDIRYFVIEWILPNF